MLVVRGRGDEVVVADVDHQLRLTRPHRSAYAPQAVAAGVVAPGPALADGVDERRVAVQRGDLGQLAVVVEHVDDAPVAEARGTTSDGTRCITVRGSRVAIRIGLASDRHRQALSGRLGLDAPLVLPLEEPAAHVLDQAALGHVRGDADHLDRLVAGVDDGASPHLEPALLAVHAHDADLVVEVPARLGRGDDAVAVVLAVVRVDDLGERVRIGRERVRVDPQHVGEGARPHHLVAQEVPVPAAESAGGQRQIQPGEAVGEAAGAAALLGDLGQAPDRRRAGPRPRGRRGTR